MVSVIVPHYSDLVGLDRCLEALEAQTYPKECFEIVVGDNNSPEGAEAVARVVAGRARLTIVTEKGAGPARNGALALARFETLALTDSDCVPHPQWLERGVGALAELDLVGGRMVVFPADTANVNSVESFELVFRFDNEDYIRRTNFTVTANLFTRRSIFDKVGGFLATGVSEDVEWCHRATAAGYRLGYKGDVIVRHPARPDWPALCKMTRRMDMEMFKLRVTSNVARIQWVLRILFYPLSAVAHTPKVLWSPNITGLGQRIGALIVLYRIRLLRSVIGFRLLISGVPGAA